jgi:pimeloyl-ACP methyl ester carboxylesterase
LKGHHLLVGDLRAHYLEAGKGTPLVLLHGSAIDSSLLSYGPSLPGLARDYRVIAPDWPGYGKSERPPHALGIPDYVSFLERFVDAMGLERVHLAGFSMGGGAALGFALEHPGRVHKLVLIDAYGLGNEVHVPFLPFLALKAPRLATTFWGGLKLSRRLLSVFLKVFVFADRRKVTPALVHEVYEQLRSPEVERAFMRWIRGEVGWRRLTTNYADRLGDVAAPTLLLHGARDLIVPASRSRRAARLIPGARLHLVPRCGHWLPREASKVFERELLLFLRD